MRTTTARIERSKDGYFWSRVKLGDDLITSNAKTIEGAKASLLEAIEELKESYVLDGEVVPECLNDVELEYSYDTACILEELSKYIKMEALAKEVGINASLLRQYKCGQYISDAQSRKIYDGIVAIGNKMTSFAAV